MNRPCIVLALLLTAITAQAAITIGPGPELGTDRAGVVFREEFQDWTAADLTALDETDDTAAWHDGHDSGRDIVAFYRRLDATRLCLRVDLLDLRSGWQDAVNLYVLIDCAPGGATWLPDYLDCRTDTPWEIALALYADGDTPGTTYNVYDVAYGTGWNDQLLGTYWSTDLDAMECAVPRTLLLSAGWDGETTLRFQVVSAKDFAEGGCSGGGASSDLTDAVVDDDRGCDDGSLDGAIPADATTGRVQYATIAHGNQALGRAGDLRTHVYDPESNTGIPGGTGFVRTLDTHRIFGVPLNIHLSGTLIAGLQWAAAPGGAADPDDGPALLAEIAAFVDGDQQDRPGALIGGVFAEHIMPYFEGAVNLASCAVQDSIQRAVFDLTPQQIGVMHVPERVIRSQPTGLSPLTGLTFDDIPAAGYRSVVLDAASHLHYWFHPDESPWPDQPYRHLLHRIEGVLCFLIDDREDDKKFWTEDGGLHTDTRRSLLAKALAGQHSLVVVFDDWEALAGKSFGAESGEMIPNDNPIQYQRTIRWLANHPWVEMVTLAEMLQRADADPTWIVDHGRTENLPLQTYRWLRHACEDSYHNWYYDQAGGVAGNEQSFYDLVPVISGEQGDYRRRGVGPEADGPPLPSLLPLGDLNTPGTLLHDAWATLAAAPAGRLRTLGEAAYAAMIYETAWHNEDATDDATGDGYGTWLSPDTTWDGLSTWALRLQNHARDAVGLALAAAWCDSVREGTLPAGSDVYATDADLDGVTEFVLRNRKVWTLWQDRGGRCLLAVRYDPARRDGVVLLGNPLANPSAPGEEEYADERALRCSGWKVMNGDYADTPLAVDLLPAGLRFTAPDGQVVLEHVLAAGSDTVATTVQETVAGPLYLRLGLNPDLWALLLHGPASLERRYDGPDPAASTWYTLAAGDVAVTVLRDDATFNPLPLHAGWDRRDLALTEEVELAGDGTWHFRTALACDGDATAVPDHPRPSAGPELLPGAPNPFNPRTLVRYHLPVAGAVRLTIHDLRGRLVRHLLDGRRQPAGEHAVPWDGRADDGRAVPAGLYLVRLAAPGGRADGKITLVR